MAYIILTANGEEIECRELTTPVIIGRSPDVDVPVRDILMSRKHCRLEPGTGKDKGRWRFVDLGSSNGSHVDWKKIMHHVLADGDAVRIGRTWLTFMAGAFLPPPEGTPLAPRKSKLVRPADPHEALRGTVADFIYVEPERAEQDFDGTPSPSETASGGAGYLPRDQRSSLRDSSVATATTSRRRARPTPRPNDPKASYVRKRGEMALSLQAQAIHVPFLEVVPPSAGKRGGRLIPALILSAGIGLATVVVLMSGWLMTRG